MFHGDIPKIVITSASLFEGEGQGQNNDINNDHHYEGSSERKPSNFTSHHPKENNKKSHKSKRHKRHKRPRNIPKIIITSESDNEKDFHSHKSCTINDESQVNDDSRNTEINTNGTSGFDYESITTALKTNNQSQIKQSDTFDSESSEITLNKQQHEETEYLFENENEILINKNLPPNNSPNKESKMHKIIRFIKKKPPCANDKRRLKVIIRILFSDKRNFHNVR